jgi:Domain of unknown function (DUF5615)
MAPRTQTPGWLTQVPGRLLLDEMFPESMAEQLRAKGYDVRAVVASPEFARLPDEQILVDASEAGRALVTVNIKDFMPLDAQYRATSRSHGGLILVSTKTFPQRLAFVPTVTNSLIALLSRDRAIQAGEILFLSRTDKDPAVDNPCG